MNKKLIIGLGTIGIILGYYLTKGTAANQLEIQTSNAKNVKLTLFNISFDLELTFYNPTNQNLSISGIGGNCFINNTPVAYTNSSENFTIEKFANSTSTIKTVISLTGLISGVKEIVDFVKGQPLTLKWQGIARTLALNIPVSSVFTINRNKLA